MRSRTSRTTASMTRGWTNATWCGGEVPAPTIGDLFGADGNPESVSGNYPNSHASSLYDVTSGGNRRCSTSQRCNGRAGWDGPTDLGTPTGTGAA